MEYNDIQEGKLYYFRGRDNIRAGPYIVKKFHIDEGEMSLPGYPIYLTTRSGVFIASVKLSEIEPLGE